MTNIVVLKTKPPQGCDLCGNVAELRPYGPKGEWVCFPCGMKDQEAAKVAFARRLSGEAPMKDDVQD